MRASIVEFCAAIGKNPMLVQGAGGNVSWKEKETLWIKASGTWIADAAHKDIFVPVDLSHLQGAIASANYGVMPRLSADSHLRPSIETHLHALMPHPVVVHLHAIDILSHLVKRDFEHAIRELLPSSIDWTMVNYYKPGVDLAKAVSIALHRRPESNVVFLQNHGVVVGGKDITEVESILSVLTEKLYTVSCVLSEIKPPDLPLTVHHVQYYPISDPLIHQLATHADLYNRLEADWALYPDHIVFLGESPKKYNNVESLQRELTLSNTIPDLIFIGGVGVFTQVTCSSGKQAQLRCYYDILSRQSKQQLLNTLNSEQIAELLHWDAEQYRMNIAMT